MQTIFSLHPIRQAFHTADEFIAKVVLDERKLKQPVPLAWLPELGNKLQARLLAPQLWDLTSAGMHLLKPDELATISDWDANTINEWLSLRGYSIQLDRWPIDRMTFGFAADMNLLRYWQTQGELGYHVASDKKAFRLGSDAAGVTFSTWQKKLWSKFPPKCPAGS